MLNTDGELKFIEFYDTIVEPGCIKRDEPCLVTDEKKYYILSPDGKRKLSKGFYFIGETRFLYNPHTDNFESIGNRKVYSCKTSSDGRTVYLEYIDGKLIRL